MAKLSKNNTYAIKWLHSQNKTAEEISEELNISITQVRNFLSKIQPEPVTNNAVQTTSGPVNGKPKDFMIRETANKHSHVAIMTKEASAMNDEFKKKHLPPTDKTQNHIYKIS